LKKPIISDLVQKNSSEIRLYENSDMQEITIDGRKIGPSQPPYIIAELSANHNGDIGRALKIMEFAKAAGADAIKLQTYTADTLTIDCDSEEFQIHGGLWDGQTLYDLYKGAAMPWEWHKPLFDKAAELGITVFSSPFDSTAVDLLEELNAPAYKIASFELIDLPLIARVARTGKPMIMSTGMADQDEIKEAIDTAKDNGCTEMVILHCVSGYPSPADQYNLKTISDISERFNVLSGLSDHTVDNATAIAAVALGACLIEKHVTLDRQGGGPDDSFSIEPDELFKLCHDAETAWQAIGAVNYDRTEAEKGNVKFRRSLYFVKEAKAGDEITSDIVKSIRPGFGLAPKHLPELLGKVLLKDVVVGQAVNTSFFNLNKE
jgi:pseudaminic acid synthase